jgi:hypothetical protein
MRIRDVDFPPELVDAHRDGRLVLFIGAGASIAPPSGLPTFHGLTAEIAAESGVTLDDDQLDRFLGVLQDDRHVDVHARVVAKIVALATGHPAGLTEHSSLLDDLDDDQLSLEPTAYAKLLTHLLRHTNPPFYGYLRLPALVKKLRELVGPTAARDIVEEAVRLGCPGAADW